jgi:hypothetical protein
MRKVEACMNCGETRNIAAHGLCFTCYRRGTRQTKHRESKSVSTENFRLVAGYCQILKALATIEVIEGDVVSIKRILAPYLEPAARLLQLTSRSTQDTVAAEFEGDEQATDLAAASEREHA